MDLLKELKKLDDLFRVQLDAEVCGSLELSKYGGLSCSWKYNGYIIGFELVRGRKEDEVYLLEVIVSSENREEKYDFVMSKDYNLSLADTVIKGVLMIMFDYRGLVNKEENL